MLLESLRMQISKKTRAKLRGMATAAPAGAGAGGGPEVLSVRRFESGPPPSLALQVDAGGDTYATTKEEEWVTKKKTELTTTRQIETRVQRQVVLEDGHVVEDSGPRVTTNTTEDTQKHEQKSTEHRTTGDAPPPGPGWLAVTPVDGVLEETTEKIVRTRDEQQDLTETEDVMHLGDISDQTYQSAVTRGSDLRRALEDAPLDAGALQRSAGPRLVTSSSKKRRVVDSADVATRRQATPDGRVVTETKRTTEHEEEGDEELPDDDRGGEGEESETRKEGSSKFIKTKDEDFVEYIADGVKVGEQMRFHAERTEGERHGACADGLHQRDADTLSARMRHIRRKGALPNATAQAQGTAAGTAPTMDRKDALTRRPLDFDHEEETRKHETSKWLTHHFGSDSRSDTDEDNDLPAAGTNTSFINVTMKSQPLSSLIKTQPLTPSTIKTMPLPSSLSERHRFTRIASPSTPPPEPKATRVYVSSPESEDAPRRSGGDAFFQGVSDWERRDVQAERMTSPKAFAASTPYRGFSSGNLVSSEARHQMVDRTMSSPVYKAGRDGNRSPLEVNRSPFENKSQQEFNRSPLDVNRSPFENKSQQEFNRSHLDLNKSQQEFNRSHLDSNKSQQEFTRSHLDLNKSNQEFTRSHLDLNKSQDLNRSHLELNRSPVDMNKSYQELSRSYLDLNKSHQDASKSYQDLNKSYQDPSRSYQDGSKGYVNGSQLGYSRQELNQSSFVVGSRQHLDRVGSPSRGSPGVGGGSPSRGSSPAHARLNASNGWAEHEDDGYRGYRGGRQDEPAPDYSPPSNAVTSSPSGDRDSPPSALGAKKHFQRTRFAADIPPAASSSAPRAPPPPNGGQRCKSPGNIIGDSFRKLVGKLRTRSTERKRKNSLKKTTSSSRSPSPPATNNNHDNTSYRPYVSVDTQVGASDDELAVAPIAPPRLSRQASSASPSTRAGPASLRTDTMEATHHGTRMEPTQYGVRMEPIQYGARMDGTHGARMEPIHGTRMEPIHGTRADGTHGTKMEGSTGGLQRYYLGEDPFGGSIYGREKEYDGVTPVKRRSHQRAVNGHRRGSREEDDMNRMNVHHVTSSSMQQSSTSSTLGRLSQSTGRLAAPHDVTRHAQTLPRKLHAAAPTQTIQVSIVNNQLASPAKPARTYRSALGRSQSFSVQPLGDSAAPLKTPALLASLSRSQRDLTSPEPKSFRTSEDGFRSSEDNVKKEAFMQGLLDRAPELFKTLHGEDASAVLPPGQIYTSTPVRHTVVETTHTTTTSKPMHNGYSRSSTPTSTPLQRGVGFNGNGALRSGVILDSTYSNGATTPTRASQGFGGAASPLRGGQINGAKTSRVVESSHSFRSSSTADSDPVRHLSSPYRQPIERGASPSLYAASTRGASPSLYAATRGTSPFGGSTALVNGTSRSVERRGSSDDYTETVRINSKSADPLRPSETNTVKSFSKKVVPSLAGRATETVESHETTTVTKSRLRNGGNGVGVDLGAGYPTRNGGVVIQVRPDRM